MITLETGIQSLCSWATRQLEILSAAEELYLEGGAGVTQGLSKFDDYRENIKNAQKWMEMHAKGNRKAAILCSEFPIKGPLCLSRRLHPHELLRWAEAGLSAAKLLGDRCAEATNLGNLGSTYLVINKTQDALARFEDALAIARDLDNTDCHAEANALSYLGSLYLSRRQPVKAREYYEQWLTVARRRKDRRDESIALGNLGSVCLALGDDQRASFFFKQRLEIANEIGDRRGAGDMYVNLGVIQAKAGSYECALEFFNQALVIARTLHDPRDEEAALTNIGNVYMSKNEIKSAQDTYQQCIELARRDGDPIREGLAVLRMNQSLDRDRTSDRSRAIANARRAVESLEPLEDETADYIRGELDRWLQP